MIIPQQIKREDRLVRNRKIIKSFKNLKTNWNGNHEAPIPQIIIDTALKTLDQLLVQPEVFPATDSSIQFDFTNFDNFEIEVNIYPDKFIIYTSKNNVEETKTIDNINCQSDIIINTINEFISKSYV